MNTPPSLACRNSSVSLVTGIILEQSSNKMFYIINWGCRPIRTMVPPRKHERSFTPDEKQPHRTPVVASTVTGGSGLVMMRPCPKCGCVRSKRSRRHAWERLFRLRVFRCNACSHRIARVDGERGVWRTRVVGVLVLISLIGVALIAFRFRIPLG